MRYIVADGWTGAFNPLTHPQYLKRLFSHFLAYHLRLTDRPTGRRTYGRTKPLVELYVPVTYNFLHTFEVTLSKLILQENVWEKPNSSVWSAVSG